MQLISIKKMMRIPYIMALVFLIIVNVMLFSNFVQIAAMSDKVFTWQKDKSPMMTRIRRSGTLYVNTTNMSGNFSKKGEVEVYNETARDGKHFEEQMETTTENGTTTSEVPRSLNVDRNATENKIEETDTITEMAKPMEALKSSIYIQKCCHQFEALNFDLRCEVKEENDNSNWYPEKFIRKSDRKISKINASRIQINFERWPRCPMNEVIQVAWRSNQLQEEYFIDEESGYLIQFDGDSKIAEYSPQSYCLDAVQERQSFSYHMALLCPCKEALCIKKCCPYGETYDMAEKTCVKSDTSSGLIKLFHPEFYLRSVLETKPAYYFINNGSTLMPECAVTLYTQIKGNLEELANSKIDVTGDIVWQKGTVFNYLAKNNKYCIDEFLSNNTHKIRASFCKDDNMIFQSSNYSSIVSDLITLENDNLHNTSVSFDVFVLKNMFIIVIMLIYM